MKKAYFLSFFLALLLLCASCTVPPNIPDPAPTPTPDASEDQEQIFLPTQPDEQDPIRPTPVKHVTQIDTDSLTKNGLSLQRIFVCDNDTILCFVSPVNSNGTISESVILYSYSMASESFRPVSLMLGTVGFYPDRVYEDGTVSVVTLNSETYDYETILFIDPVTLTTQNIPAPAAQDYYSLLLSPNKQYAALTSYDQLLICDLTGSQTYFRLERWQATQANGETLEHIPSAARWSDDNSILTVDILGVEACRYPAFIRTADWSFTPLETLTEMSIFPTAGGSFFYQHWPGALPTGFYDPTTGQSTVLHLSCATIEDIDFCGITRSMNSTYLCASYLYQQSDNMFCAALIADAATGADINTFILETGDDFCSFEQTYFTPDEKRVVLMSSATYNSPRQIYLFDFTK